jgi:phage gpG-like protein
MLNATLELRGFDEAIQEALRAAAQQALEIAAAQARERLRQRFASEGKLYGPGWLPRKSGNERLPHRPLLFSTGRLSNSFTERNDPEHLEILQEGTDPTRPTLLFGSCVPYAAFHQWGTTRMPARPILTAEVLGGE